MTVRNGGRRCRRLCAVVELVAVAMVAASCVFGGSVTRQEATRVDFLGEVVSVDADDWTVRSDPPGIAWSPGGPHSRLLVGPASLHLADGSVLDVPAETHGGNSCSLVGYRDLPRTETCLVAGEFDDTGAVEWMALQPAEKWDDGTITVDVIGFEGRDALVRFGSAAVAVPIRTDATLRCQEPGDLAATPVEVPPQSTTVAQMNAAIEIIFVECLYH